MHITAIKKGLSHPAVLTISQRLDKLINEYYNAGTVKKIDAKQQLKCGNIKSR